MFYEYLKERGALNEVGVAQAALPAGPSIHLATPTDQLLAGPILHIRAFGDIRKNIGDISISPFYWDALLWALGMGIARLLLIKT